MRVVSLGSGSSGNALLVEAGPQGRTKLLVDAGLSGRTLTERLQVAKVHPSQLQGVLVTHEHRDHVIGLATLMKRYAVPVVADPRTYEAFCNGLVSSKGSPETHLLMASKSQTDLKWLAKTTTVSLAVGTGCVIGDIEVVSFPIPHDAVAPCGYLLKAGGCRVCVVTDSGEVTLAMLDMIQHADLLVLEANHDRERLLRGPYPSTLKQRILSTLGHLSNDQAAEAVLRTWRTDAVRWLWLSHLSRTNNTPSLALSSLRRRLLEAKVSLTQLHISVLPPHMGEAWDSTQLWHAPSLWEIS